MKVETNINLTCIKFYDLIKNNKLFDEFASSDKYSILLCILLYSFKKEFLKL